MKQRFYLSHGRRPFGFNPIMLGKKAKAWRIYRKGLALPASKIEQRAIADQAAAEFAARKRQGD